MKLSRKTIAVFGLTVLIIGGGVSFNRWTNHPVSTVKSSSTGGEVLSSEISLKPFTTDYFTTLLPDTFQLKTQTENARAPIMAMYLFKDTDFSIADQLGITVGKYSESSINSISAAKLRSSKPDEYKRITINNMPSNSIAYERIDGYEKAVFWQKNGHYITVVLSGTTQRRPQLDTTLQTILTNWQ